MSLISSCMGNNNQELNNMLINNKEEAFSGTKMRFWVNYLNSISKDFLKV